MAIYERVSCVEAIQRVTSDSFIENTKYVIVAREHIGTLRLIFSDQEVIDSINYLISQKKIDMQKIIDFSFWE